jgi:hypothetical protein
MNQWNSLYGLSISRNIGALAHWGGTGALAQVQSWGSVARARRTLQDFRL